MQISPVNLFNSSKITPQKNLAQNNNIKFGQRDHLDNEAFLDYLSAVFSLRGNITTTPKEIKTALENFKAAQEKSKSALMTEEAYVMENAKKTQKYAQEVSAIAQRIYDEANSAYRQGEKNISPALFRKIEDYGNTKIIKEILNGENGTIIRISTFENGQLRDVEEGYKVSYDGTIYKGKEITYDENGALEWYNEGYKQTPDGHWNREKRANFKDGKLRLYEENLTGDKTNFLGLGKRICFVDGSLSYYMEDLKRNLNKELEIPRKELYLENGKIKSGYTSSEILPDNSIEFKNRTAQGSIMTIN